MSVMLSALQIAFRATKSVHGEPITYTQGVTNVTIDKAVRGQSDPMRMSVQPGFTTEETLQDWLIDFEDLGLTPGRNDTITDASGRVYRVLPPGQDEPIWRWHGNTPEVAYRIHTKQR